MATTKRERQKAARRLKMEQQRREAARRRNVRRSVIVSVIAVVVVLSGSLLFAGSSGNNTSTTTLATSTTLATTTTTSLSTTTTVTPQAWTPVTEPQAAGKFGTAPTVVVPTSAAPTVPERTDLIVGTGTTLNTGDTFSAQYVLADYATHKVLQSSWPNPFSSTLDTGHLIPGWVSGLAGMKVGGRRELVLPPNLGYGSAGSSGIAPNDTLIFVVDLVSVTPAK